MADILNAVVQYLQADTDGVMSVATAVHPRQAPEKDVEYPCVVVHPWKPPEGQRVFQQVAFEEAIFLVRACDQNTSHKTVGQINKLIRARLENATLAITDMDSLAVSWIRDVDTIETEHGVQYRSEGGLYYVAAEAS